MKRITTLLFIFPVVLLVSCQRGANREKRSDISVTVSSSETMEVKYAQGFTVTDKPGYRLVEVKDPVGENSEIYRYAFVPKGTGVTDIPAGYQVIETPVQGLICMTNLQLSNFIKLDALDRVVGMSSTRFLFNRVINEQLKKGQTSKIGIEGNFDTELIIALDPELILVSPFKRGGYESIRNLDIPLVSFLGYKESSPLGQAEWIKFTAMLLGLEEQANSRFREIEEKYLDLCALVASAGERPTVLSGELHSGNWYVVGGNSYLAQLFRDAGGEYFRTNEDESGGFYVDFETVYSEAANADYWRIVNSFTGEFTYEALKGMDARYADFKAWQEKNIIYCNLREKPFYENTPVEPEVVLADLIHIFYPDLLPDHTPVYYELLK